MRNEENQLISYNQKNKLTNDKTDYTLQNALDEFEELKNIALNCFDKNGNPNISAALKAVENKAKIAGLYSTKEQTQSKTIVQMNEIKIDGEQLKLNIGEEFN